MPDIVTPENHLLRETTGGIIKANRQWHKQDKHATNFYYCIYFATKFINICKFFASKTKRPRRVILPKSKNRVRPTRRRRAGISASGGVVERGKLPNTHRGTDIGGHRRERFISGGGAEFLREQKPGTNGLRLP
jgi:hypothetical protein